MARQFLSTDTAPWRDGFGNGIDGVKTVSSNATYDGVKRSCSGTSGSTSLTLGSSGFTNGMPVLIHQTRGTGVGNWELNKVASGGGTTSLTMAYTLQNTYTDSGDSQAQIIELKQYASVTVNSGITWSAPDWDGDTGGIIAFLCNGPVTVTGTINADAKGFRGGGESSGGGSNSGEGTEGPSSDDPAIFGPAIGNGAGTAGNDEGYVPVNGGITGGGVGAGGNQEGTPTHGGEDAGNPALTNMVLGGGGSSGENSDDAVGGDGGGIVMIFAPSLTVTGSITADGGAGGNATGGQDNGGGGGGGGCILLKGHLLTLGSSLVTATGGAGGTGDDTGGAGGNGRIHADYLYTVTGTTTPTIDTDQENALLDKGSSFLFNSI